MWGTLLNTNFALIDSAVAGLLALSVAGSANVVLTTTNGAADQARNAMFVFSGVLTGNINVLWPNSKTAVFSVKNSTTGSFSLSLGANNGSSLPAGAVAVIAQGAVGIFYSDGTNVYVRGAGTSVGGDLSGTLPNPTVTATHLSAALPINQGGTGSTLGTVGGDLTGTLPNPTIAALTVTAAKMAGAARVVQSQTFTATGTFTVPAGATTATAFKFTFSGGGGAGGGGTSGGSSFLAPGGGSGACGYAVFTGFTGSGSVTVTCGAGGAGASGATGNTGASTTIAYAASNFVTAVGGTGGAAGSNVFQVGGAAGTFSTNAGGSGLTLVDSGTLASQRGGTSMIGSISGASGAGGPSVFAEGGVPKIGFGTNLAGAVGVKGAGGSGGTGGINTVGGAGGDGVVLVEWVL